MFELFGENLRVTSGPVQHRFVENTSHHRWVRLPGEQILAGHAQFETACEFDIAEFGITDLDDGLRVRRRLEQPAPAAGDLPRPTRPDPPGISRGQEDQLGCLGLVLNAVTRWMTRYLNAAVAQLCAQGIQVRDEDAARLSPLKAKKVNVLGRYAIVASQPIEGLRPLLDPTNPGGQDVLD